MIIRPGRPGFAAPAVKRIEKSPVRAAFETLLASSAKEANPSLASSHSFDPSDHRSPRRPEIGCIGSTEVESAGTPTTLACHSGSTQPVPVARFVVPAANEQLLSTPCLPAPKWDRGVGLPGPLSELLAGIPGHVSMPATNEKRVSKALVTPVPANTTYGLKAREATVVSNVMATSERSPMPVLQPRIAALVLIDLHQPQLLELHVRSQFGSDEIVSVPWRLVANSRLSQVLVDAGEYGSAREFAHAQQGGGKSLEDILPQLEATVTPVDAEDEPMRLIAWLSLHDDRPGGAEARAPVGSRTAPHASMTAWANRLVRFLEQYGHDLQIWIRDFGLDERAARQLADAMRTHSQNQGIRLERIVVNAQEIWRAPSYALQQEMT